jgi:hypothetical protein
MIYDGVIVCLPVNVFVTVNLVGSRGGVISAIFLFLVCLFDLISDGGRHSCFFCQTKAGWRNQCAVDGKGSWGLAALFSAHVLFLVRKELVLLGSAGLGFWMVYLCIGSFNVYITGGACLLSGTD